MLVEQVLEQVVLGDPINPGGTEVVYDCVLVIVNQNQGRVWIQGNCDVAPIQVDV